MNLKQALKEALYQDWKSIKETQYAIVDKGDTVLIAFQGSMDWRDWLLNFYCIPYKDMEQPFYVHAGFLKQYKNVRDIILEAIKDKKKVELRGHSLGGALCLLAHEDIRFHDKGIEIETITFGAPRVLAKKGSWGTFIGRLSDRKRIGDISYFSFVMNIVNGNDVVPRVPFWYVRNTNIKHIGGKERWWKLSIVDHLPANYFISLKEENYG